MAIILYIIIFTITLFILYKNQLISGLIRPGWFFSIVTFFYYGFPLIYLKFDPDYTLITFNRVINTEFLDYICIILLIGQVAFLFSEILVTKFLRHKQPIIKLKDINNTIIYIFLGLSYFLFFYRWNLVGGYINILGMNRVDYINAVAGLNSYSRYDLTLNIATLFLTIKITLHNNFIRKNKVLIGAYLLLLLLILLMGTRLLILNYIIGFFCILYTLNKKFIIQRKKSLFFSLLTILFFLITYQSIRNDIQQHFTSGKFNITTEKISIIPNEFFTGILSEHSLKMGNKPNDQISYFQRLIPTSVKSLIGIKQYDRYVEEIANYSVYSSGRLVYTIPFIFDVYHGAGNNILLFI